MKIHLNTPAPEGDIVVNPKPNPPELLKHGLISAMISAQKQHVDKTNKQREQEYEDALKQWEQAEVALKNNPEVMSVVITNALASIEWPRETSVSFDIVDNGGTVLLDVDLPEIEDMPTQQAQISKKNFQLTTKDISQSQKQLDYLTHIHAIGFRFNWRCFCLFTNFVKSCFFGLLATCRQANRSNSR